MCRATTTRYATGDWDFLCSGNDSRPLSHTQNCTPFYAACRGGHTEVIKLLLDDGRVNPNAVSNKGATPFFSAASHGHAKAVTYLLGRPEINIALCLPNGFSPLCVAAQNGHTEVRSIDTPCKTSIH